MLFSALCFVSALAGCSRDTGPPPDTIVVVMQGDAQSLDPHAVTDAGSMRMIENMYSTLLRYGKNYRAMQTQPALAESYEVSEDQLTYTFRLNPDARFHSGRLVTAEDVAYSLRRIIDQGVRSNQLSAIDTIHTPDNRTVVLKLAHRSAPLLTHLANPMNAIVDRRAIEDEGLDPRTADVGSGPYRLEAWERGQELRLAAHHGYHFAELPKTPRITFRPTPDPTARSTAIRTGEAHLLHEVPPKDRELIGGAEGVRVIAKPGTFWEYVGMNCEAPPLDDPRVRSAIAHAIDRPQLVRAVKFGHATPLDGGNIPPNHWAHPALSIYPEPDRDRARELLAEAGYTGRLALDMIVDASVSYQVRAAEMIKQHLRAIGIDVTLRSLESSVFFQQLGAGDFELSIVGWMGFVDPDEYVHELFHSDGQYNQQNYANSRVDALIERGVRTLGRDQRQPIYRDILETVAHEAPMAFLYVNPQTSAIRENIENYFVHPTGTTLFLGEAELIDR